MRKILVLSAGIILLIFIFILVFIRFHTVKHVLLPPVKEKSGKTLPELLQLDSIPEMDKIRSGTPESYNHIYITDEQQTKIAESAIRELIRNSDSITFHSRKDKNYVGEWDSYIVDDKKFLKLLSENFILESDIIIFAPGPGGGLLNEYITFQPSGLMMKYICHWPDTVEVWDTTDRAQSCLLRKLNDEFVLLYLYYFENIILRNTNYDSDSVPRHIYQYLIDKNEKLEETLSEFKEDIEPYAFVHD